MLSERQKRRIKEEEIFRLEVQKALASEKDNKSLAKKFWDFLNSSLGIWVLTTIVIGLITWSYSQWQSAAQNDEQIYKLDIEIENRFDAIEHEMRYGKIEDQKPPFYLANKLLLPTPEDTTHAEFANRNLKSLLYELSGRLPYSEKQQVESTISLLNGLDTNYVDKGSDPQRFKAFEVRVGELRNNRWRWDKMLDRRVNKTIDNPAKILYLVFIFPLLYISFKIYQFINLWQNRKKAK